MENSGPYTYAKRIAPLIRASTRVLSTLRLCMRFAKSTVFIINLSPCLQRSSYCPSLRKDLHTPSPRVTIQPT